MARSVPRQSRLFFTLILVLSAILIWLVFRPFVIYMVTGLFVAVLALPIDRFWERRLPNRVAAFFTMFTVFLILILPLVAIGYALVSDAKDLADSVQDGELQDWAVETLHAPLPSGILDLFYGQQNATARNETIANVIDDAERTAITAFAGFARDVVSLLPNFFIGVTVVLFVVYYVLTDGDRLVLYVRRVAPLPGRQVDYLLSEARNGLHAVFVGQILTSMIQGALGGVGFLIAGLPGAILWAAVMAILSLLPVVGAFLVWIPAAIFLLVTGDIWQGIFLVIWGAVVVSQVDNIIRPRLIGNRANIHPIFVLIGVLGGVAAFGFIGLFLGPLLVGVFMSVLRVWETDYLDREEPGDPGPADAADEAAVPDGGP